MIEVVYRESCVAGYASMMTEENRNDQVVSGSAIWTLLGWLAFALPLGLYLIMRIA